MMKRGSGFTLIEIVVAVAIFGVIMSIVFPTLAQFLDLRERLQQKHQEIAGLQKAFLFMANDFRYAANRSSKDEYGEPVKTTLSIDDGALINLTALYPDVNLDGLNVPRRLQWVLEDGALKRIQYPVMDPDATTRAVTQILLRDVQSVAVEVSHIEDGRSNTDDKWNEGSSLPGLIAIDVEFLNGIEFRRVFTMVGGDKQKAVAAEAATSVEPSINPESDESTSDQDTGDS